MAGTIKRSSFRKFAKNTRAQKFLKLIFKNTLKTWS